MPSLPSPVGRALRGAGQLPALRWRDEYHTLMTRDAGRPGWPPGASNLEPVEAFRCARCGTSAAARATHAAHVAEPRIASAGGTSHWRLHHTGRTDHASTNSYLLRRSGSSAGFA